MSYRKFGKNDVLINTLKAHPKNRFFIYDTKIYHNNRGVQTGMFQGPGIPPGAAAPTFTAFPSASGGNIYMSDPGYVNLYEYNIDRPDAVEGDPTRIHPFASKDGSRSFFTDITSLTLADFLAIAAGDEFAGFYPQTASIRREFITTPSGSKCHDEFSHTTLCEHNMSYWSLKNLLNHYGVMSPHYLVSSSYDTDDADDGWSKDNQKLNLIHIPSIFYGSKIRPGTVELQWYFTGSLLAELKDERENGELIQTGPPGNPGSGSVAGVVLYNEGFILLTGSWALTTTTLKLEDGAEKTPQWLYWGAGARDGSVAELSGAADDAFLNSASFGLSFEGVSKTETLTMYARAPRGKVNYSNNPTFLQHDQEQLTFTSSHVYEENKNRLIKNTVSSSYSNYEEDFKRQVYISKVAVYDDQKQLIGIATLSNPVLKEEEQDLAIKIKLDI